MTNGKFGWIPFFGGNFISWLLKQQIPKADQTKPKQNGTKQNRTEERDECNTNSVYMKCNFKVSSLNSRFYHNSKPTEAKWFSFDSIRFDSIIVLDIFCDCINFECNMLDWLFAVFFWNWPVNEQVYFFVPVCFRFNGPTIYFQWFSYFVSVAPV